MYYMVPIKKIEMLSIIFLISLLIFSCGGQSDQDKVRVDFSKRETINTRFQQKGKPLRAAVAARISPIENFFHYNEIFDYLSRRMGRRIVFKQRKTYEEINNLLESQELDFAFVCSGAYVKAKDENVVELLAVPQIKGKMSYLAYIIVHEDADIIDFDDLKGRSFAFTDPLSNTGCLYPIYLLKAMSRTEKDFFSDVIFTYAHDYSIQAVSSRIVDAASVDALIFDFLQEHSPQKTSKIRIIKRSVPFGIPPVVVSPRMNSGLKEELQSVFLAMDADPRGREILSHLDIDRFVLGIDRDYDSIRMMRRVALE